VRTTPKSLSVVVPVHNAERNLTQRIGCLLEVLPDLAAKFEVLIVDDGSTDQTEEMALELSHRYPQVRVKRHSQQRGIEASAQTGAAHTTGDIVIVHAGQESVNASKLQRMWQHREDEELVVAPVGGDIGGVGSKGLRQLEDWGQGAADEPAEAPVRGARQLRAETGRPFVRPSGPPKKAAVPPPTFRFSSSGEHSWLHQ